MTTTPMLDGLLILLGLLPLACAAWLLMLWFAFWLFGVSPRRVLREITVAEALFFAGYGYSAAVIVSSVAQRFI